MMTAAPALGGASHSAGWSRRQWFWSGALVALAELSWPVRSTEGPLGIGGGELFRVVGVLAMLGISFLVLSRRENRPPPIGFVVPVVLYSGVAALSGLASDFPLLALWEAVEFTSVWLLGWAALGARSPSTGPLFRGVLSAYSLNAIWVMIQALYSDDAIRRISAPIPIQLQGIVPTVNPNQFGMMAAVGVVWLVWFRSSRIPRPVALVSLSAVLAGLALSQSRTTWLIVVTLSLALILTRMAHFSRQNLLMLGLVLTTLSVAAPVVGESIMDTALRGQDLRQTATLSGRTAIWAEAISGQPQVSELLGGGIGISSRQISTSAVAFLKEETTLGSAHNGYVEAYLSAGWVGSLPYQLFVGWIVALAIWEILRSRDLRSRLVGVSVVVIAIGARNMTGSVLSAGSTELLLFVAGFAVLGQRYTSRAEEGPT